MKILIFLTRWEGGVGSVVRNLKKELEKKGHVVISISREDELKCFSSIKRIFWLRKKYRDIIKKENPDIIYTQDWSMALPLLLPFKIFAKNHYCGFHGSNEGFSRMVQTFIAKKMKNHLIVGSMLNKKRYPWGKLIPNAVDLNFFKPLGKKRDRIGWINKESEEISKKEFIKLAKELNMPYIIAEKIPYKKMNAFFNSCEIFLSLPPSCAGCALAYREAMAAGVPRIIGNYYGDSKCLPINKIENFKSLKYVIKRSKKYNYRRWLIDNKITWSDHVDKLLQWWGKNG